jgi:hypothetical protein
VAIRDSVPIWSRELAERHVRNSRTQAGVWSTLDTRTELLHGPGGRRVLRHVPVHDSTRIDVQDRKETMSGPRD